jgi:hypothetical protein
MTDLVVDTADQGRRIRKPRVLRNYDNERASGTGQGGSWRCVRRLMQAGGVSIRVG